MADSVIKLERAFIYQRNYLVLSNVDFELNEGEFAYLIGKTGSGKSSLLKVLYGALPLTEGYGKVVGQELKGMKTGKIPLLRRHLGIVFQQLKLFVGLLHHFQIIIIEMERRHLPGLFQEKQKRKQKK